MSYMEEFDNEKYNTIESIETVFQRINRFGLEYNCCFGCFVPPATFQVAGIIKDKLTKNNLTGYLVNKYDQGICLIPLVVNDKKKICINMYGYIDIKDSELIVEIKTLIFV